MRKARPSGRLPLPDVAALAVFVLTAVVFLLRAPTALAFSVAAIAAASWCRWLEEHPE